MRERLLEFQKSEKKWLWRGIYRGRGEGLTSSVGPNAFTIPVVFILYLKVPMQQSTSTVVFLPSPVAEVDHQHLHRRPPAAPLWTTILTTDQQQQQVPPAGQMVSTPEEADCKVFYSNQLLKIRSQTRFLLLRRSSPSSERSPLDRSRTVPSLLLRRRCCLKVRPSLSCKSSPPGSRSVWLRVRGVMEAGSREADQRKRGSCGLILEARELAAPTSPPVTLT
ncbi:hypothetical protein NC653_010534 [Populus alba x Populus x berolinensis]|uniref:Uncharacterized protein n=1 Tax=Populus alba x Populus x berolinensis TaxID=444605 RepID=A0AAD6W6I7_9ROSI|nr:hypothetical protein NC653_010534 [Populus alba x Populus x berolinensis]